MPPPKNSAEPGESRSNFLVTELEICSTLLKVVETELRAGWRDAAGRALEGAEKAYGMIQRLLPNRNHAEQTELELKSNLAGEMLHSLRRRLTEPREAVTDDAGRHL